ncbi:hypothetical protein B0A50_01535 [Salinomyces thailandicus]|uniref:Calcineurin-like phosphoesterase domain-containing protein n=1 Tax=Salinomyces thailandicus TaxID=706561 RepID=A0A4V5N5L9_9PEZI|nr:hypothetical protein B0A50_01535 [Salinomyces thailandica]
MTRRITRTLGQAAALLLLLLILLFAADYRYQVLPASLHPALPSHHPRSVVTDVQIAFCSRANPFSRCRLDADEWQRVEKDLYLHSGWARSAWLHVKRKREEELTEDDRVVVGVRVGRLDPGVGESGQGEERWESREGGVWLLRSGRKHESDSDRALTAVDVLFGADAVDPRPGWTLAETPLLLNAGDDMQLARLSTRHGRPKADEKPPVPRVNKDGKFKILQFSDAHLATGTGSCRDAIGPDNAPSPATCEADPRTLEFLESVLDSEMPDLAVLSGDQVEGPQAPDTQSTLFKLAAPFISRHIPYAAIFGNHDDQGKHALSRTAQMSLLQTLPYSLSRSGPPSLDGVGNYYVEVLTHSPASPNSALTLYLLDTHSLTPDEKHYKGYAWLTDAQTHWFRTTAQSLKREHARYSRIHLDMAFLHIPLPEQGSHDLLVTGGEWKEGVTAPAYNSHFYDALADEGIVAVGCGHDHVNDYCGLLPNSASTSTSTSGDNRLGPWLCYAGGSGFGGYAGYGGFHRRVRVWEVDTGAGRVVTWKRVECCGDDVDKRIDEVVLVEGGVVVAPQPSAPSRGE